MRRASLILWLMAVITASTPALAAAASLYNAPQDCITQPPVGWITAPSVKGDQFIVHAPAADAGLAADAAHEIRTKDFFGSYEAHLNIGALGYLGQAAPYDVYLDPELQASLPDGGGVNAPMCDNAARNAADVYTKVQPADSFHAALAHELFHAAQSQLAGNYANNWFYEASATWAETRFGYADPDRSSTSVTDQPMLPMDTFKSPTDGTKQHEYGAWTFVAWLFSEGKLNWTTLKDIFTASAHSPTTPILDTKLGARGTTLGEQVARYWADHTNAKPQFGPKTKVKPDVVKAPEETIKIKLAPYLGARVNGLKLAAGREQLIVIVHKVPPGVQIWVNLGHNEFLSPSEGDSLNDTFCRGKATGGSYELPKNGVLPLAITSVKPSAPKTLKLKVLTSPHTCPKPLVIDPGLAVGPLHLGMSLKAADQALPKRTPLHGPVPTVYGAYTVADYREAKGSGAIAGFLDGRIAFLLVASPDFETTTGIRTLSWLPPAPPPSQTFVPGSTAANFGAKQCAGISDSHPASMYCWKEGPKTRYTLITSLHTTPCEPFGDSPPACTIPTDDYVAQIAVATSRGLKLIHLGVAVFGNV